MMTSVDWIPLISTGVGAAIAFGGTVVADQLRRRDSRHRYSYGERQRAYAEMVLAYGAALEALRAVASSQVPAEKLKGAAGTAVSKAGVYIAREKVLMTAPPGIVRAAEAAFDALIAVRDAVRTGTKLDSREYHAAYHPYAEQMWLLRNAVREDLSGRGLEPEDIGKTTWSGEAECQVCATSVAVMPADVPA